MQSKQFLLHFLHIKSVQLVKHKVTFIAKQSQDTLCLCNHCSSSKNCLQNKPIVIFSIFCLHIICAFCKGVLELGGAVTVIFWLRDAGDRLHTSNSSAILPIPYCELLLCGKVLVSDFFYLFLFYLVCLAVLETDTTVTLLYFWQRRCSVFTVVLNIICWYTTWNVGSMTNGKTKYKGNHHQPVVCNLYSSLHMSFGSDQPVVCSKLWVYNCASRDHKETVSFYLMVNPPSVSAQLFAVIWRVNAIVLSRLNETVTVPQFQ